MHVTVRAFARLRELLGDERRLEIFEGATVGDVWAQLPDDARALRASTRIARNGVVAADAEPIGNGDELALLPPVGGG